MSDKTIRNYNDVFELCAKIGKKRIAVAAANDHDVLKAVKMAEDMGLADAILVGSADKVTLKVKELGLRSAVIVGEEDDVRASQLAVGLIREGKADVLMKGLVNTSDFLRAVLEAKKTGGALLSHLAVFEIPGQHKLLFQTDGGMNINPDLGQKKAILNNALDALGRLGIVNPKVAIVTANEKVHPKYQSTVDAAALVQMRKDGEIPTGVIEGPIALDVALSAEAAKHKGLHSDISGDVDLYLVPNIDTGNIWGKSLIYFAKAQMAGIVVGADYPIVLTSRSETPEGKLISIALACLISQR
jgi:phosphate butyryltransferase